MDNRLWIGKAISREVQYESIAVIWMRDDGVSMRLMLVEVVRGGQTLDMVRKIRFRVCRETGFNSDFKDFGLSYW